VPPFVQNEAVFEKIDALFEKNDATFGTQADTPAPTTLWGVVQSALPDERACPDNIINRTKLFFNHH
jgi:hypothetical protein